MSDAAGQLTNRLHLLQLADLRLSGGILFHLVPELGSALDDCLFEARVEAVELTAKAALPLMCDNDHLHQADDDRGIDEISGKTDPLV